MPEYRYYSADLLTGAIISDLPLYGVWLQRILSSSGQGTASFKLDTGIHNDMELIQGSEPGRTVLYCERDGTLIWSGIIWARTYNSDAKVCNLNMSTFESWFARTVMEADFIKTGVDQITIFKDMLTVIEAQQGSNILLDSSTVIGTSGVNREITHKATEFHYASEVVDQIVNVENGIDYTIEAQTSNVIDMPTRKVLIGYPRLGSIDLVTAPAYDYPGNISTYFWPESGIKAGTRVAGIGTGIGDNTIISVYTDSQRLAEGWPALWVVNSYKEIGTQPELDARTLQDAVKYRVPYSVPTFELKPDAAASFESWNALGNIFGIYIEDARFPAGKTVNSRMIGWELFVADSDNVEKLRLLIEGENDA